MQADRRHKSHDPEALALAALGWTLADEDKRAQRLVALTGLTPAGMRERLGDRDFARRGAALPRGP